MNVVIYLIIFLCLLQILILYRITQVLWHIVFHALYPRTRSRKMLESEPPQASTLASDLFDTDK